MSDPISFINPSAPVITTPYGVDQVIKALQEDYAANLSWLEKSFGRAFIMSRKTDDQGDASLITRQDYIYPGLWQADGSDMYDGMANDNLDAYSFFVKEGNETPLDYQQRQRNQWEVELSNIFWFDLQRVDSTKTYPFNEELLDEVKQRISSVRFTGLDGASVEVLQVFDKPQEVFQGFTIDMAETQHLYYPKGGFRILLRAVYTDFCA